MKYLTPLSLRKMWNKIRLLTREAHFTCEAYFTLWRSISLAEGEFHWKKPFAFANGFFLVIPFQNRSVSQFFRNRSVFWGTRIDLYLGDDGSSTWPLSSGVLLHACKRSYVERVFFWFFEMIHKTNRLIISAQKKNWHISATIERILLFFIFFANAKSEIELLVTKTI